MKTLINRYKSTIKTGEINYKNFVISYCTHIHNDILYYKINSSRDIVRKIDLSKDLNNFSKLNKLILRDVLKTVMKAHNLMEDKRLSKDVKLYMLMTKSFDYKEAMNKFYELNDLDKFLEFMNIVDYKELYTYKLMKMRIFLKVNNDIDNYLIKIDRERELREKLAVKEEITKVRRKI